MNNKKIKTFVKKFKSQSKILKILYLLIGIGYLISLIFFTKSIISLKGIETLIRIIGLIILYLHLIIHFLIGLILLFTGKKKRLVLIIILSLIYGSIISFASFHIDKTYNIIDKVQKKYVNYTSVLMSLNTKETFEKIGIISAKNDPTGYVIPKEMINEYHIEAELVEYDDYISMVSDLYDGAIDAMFVADNYSTMFMSYEKFENIATETKVIYTKSKEMENVDNIVYSTKDLKEPFTILLMGVDSTGDGIASGSSFNGDSLMLITFNPKTLSATIFSIPRDTFVPISCRNNTENKINSSAYGGTSCVVNTIENLTGITIDHYVKINFTGVVKLVDDLGGVEVDVPIKFCEQDSQRRFEEYLICLDKGKQTLNGEQALALARHRHSLPLGDFQRVQHQQLVVEAMLQSLKSIRDIDTFYKIMDDVINNIDTNMSTSQILSLYNVGKNILINKLKDGQKLSIQKTYLTGYDLTIYSPLTKSYTYTFQYYKQSLDEIVHAMKENLGLEDPKLIKTFNYDNEKLYEPSVAGKKYFSEQRRELLPNFVGKTKEYIAEWASTKEIEINYIEVDENNPLYDKTYSNDTIVSQQEHQGTIVDILNSITVYVIKKTNATSENKEEKINNDESENGNNEEGQKEEIKETLPNFEGKSISEFNKWKNSLQNANIIFDTVELTEDEIIALGEIELTDNTIYKQSIKADTDLSTISSLTVYYYAKKE